MRYIYFGICFLLFLFSCNNVKSEILVNNIEVRVFNFSTEKYNFFNAQKVKVRKNNKVYFVYDFDNHKDTLMVLYGNFFYKNKKLKKIDRKEISFNEKHLIVSKYLYEDMKNFKSDKYLYINKDIGLIFTENLFTGNMYEYDIKNYRLIHKQIALNKLKFKSGTFELEHAKRVYKDY